MLRNLLILTLCLAPITAMAQKTGIHASDARITYIGRVHRDSSSVSFDYTGTYMRVRFYGKHLSVKLSDTGRNYYNLYLDRPISAEPDCIITTTGDTTITLFSAKRAKEHTITLYKRTEGEQGRTTIHEWLVVGELLQAAPLQSRYIEFIGDSYTCGYGAENSGPTDHFSPQTETSAKTYAAILARYFNADYTLVAHSGMGIARNYNSKFAGYYMPDRYCTTYDIPPSPAYNPQSSILNPQLTIILLGGNDFSTGQQPAYADFQANYQRLLLQIKANYGDQHPIVCCVKKDVPALTDYVQRVVDQCGLTDIYFCPFFPAVFGNDSLYLGADHHPNYLAHRQAAHVLIPYVATITGWPLNDNSTVR